MGGGSRWYEHQEPLGSTESVTPGPPDPRSRPHRPRHRAGAAVASRNGSLAPVDPRPALRWCRWEVLRGPGHRARGTAEPQAPPQGGPSLHSSRHVLHGIRSRPVHSSGGAPGRVSPQVNGRRSGPRRPAPPAPPDACRTAPGVAVRARVDARGEGGACATISLSRSRRRRPAPAGRQPAVGAAVTAVRGTPRGGPPTLGDRLGASSSPGMPSTGRSPSQPARRRLRLVVDHPVVERAVGRV